jgi:hypothetical protein
VVEIRPADPSRSAEIAGVLGRAFVTEPMMTWPLGGWTSTPAARRSWTAVVVFPAVDADRRDAGTLEDEGVIDTPASL